MVSEKLCVSFELHDCCLVLFKKNKQSVHVVTKCRWKGVGVGEEEPIKNYIQVVLATQMGQRIMPNTVRESPGISFLKLSGNPLSVCKNNSSIDILVNLLSIRLA